MGVNNGFLVKSDRFSLTEKQVYYITGWLKPHHDLTAYLNGREYEVTLTPISKEVDPRYEGAETRGEIVFKEEIPQHGSLKIMVNGGTYRHLVFEIEAKELRKKQRTIKVYYDQTEVDRKKNMLHLQGWAVAKEPVDITLLDQNQKPIDCKIERYLRPDVVNTYDEFPVEERSGFNIELSPIPKRAVFLKFHAGTKNYVERFATDPVSVKTKDTVELIRKGRKYLKYNGWSVFREKVHNRLFNPQIRLVDYNEWVKKVQPTDKELAAQKQQHFEYEPLISIVVPLYKTPEKYLKELIRSVQEQTYSNWELVLSDGSPAENGVSVMHDLLKKLASSDSRIHVVENNRQLRIAENTNAALAEAKGEFIAFADHDDLLAPNALYENVKRINEKRETEMLYSDEDKVNVGNQYLEPNMKPDFSPDFLTSVNYICHLLVVKQSLLERVGNLNPEYDGAQDYDFVLRCTEQTEHIEHIPKVLYHWRFFEGSTAANPESKTYAFDAGRRAVQAHYDRLGIPAKVTDGEQLGLYRTIYQWEEKPLVSVLIPNKDHTKDLDKALKGLLSGKGYQNFEVLIIENNSTEEETFRYYEEIQKRDSRIRVITYKGGFNYSKINNFGAAEAKGEYLFLLNNDTEFISDDVVGELLGVCMRSDVGAVGARLYYGDDTIQHAGVVMGWGGVAGHAFVMQQRSATGYQHRIICQQNYSAVTAACMMVKRSVFDEIGGFTEKLAVAFNDIDLCMKIREAGYLIVYNPYCELYHYESKSRGLDTGDPEKVRRFQGEIQTFQERWPDILKNGDPYYSPNLSMLTQDFSLKQMSELK